MCIHQQLIHLRPQRIHGSNLQQSYLFYCIRSYTPSYPTSASPPTYSGNTDTGYTSSYNYPSPGDYGPTIGGGNEQPKSAAPSAPQASVAMIT